MPTGETSFTDANGLPLAGGQVFFYVPGTTTPKDTWQNSGQSILNSNPVTLDASGRAIIYGSGAYRQVVKDSLGNLIWDQETAEPNVGSVSFGGTSSGTANAQTLSAGLFSFVDGQIISFTAGLSNTGATTISIGGSASIPILKNGSSGPVNLVTGDLVAGNSYFIQYSKPSNNFQLLLSVAPTTISGAYLTGYIFGLTLSNNGTDAVNSLNISTGLAASDGTTPVLMSLASTLGKSLAANWVVGGTPASPSGGLDTGTVGNNTYHVWLIQRSDTGVVDVLFSLSASAPTMPASYDRKRRIGAIIWSSAIRPFRQNGNFFKYVTPITDRNSPSPTVATPLGLSIPNGIRVQPLMLAQLIVNASSDATMSFGDGSGGGTDIEPLVRAVNSQSSGASASFGWICGGLFSDTNTQVYFAQLASVGSISTGVVATQGWIDDRGQSL